MAASHIKTSSQLKKTIGKLILNINSDILELQKEYKKNVEPDSVKKKESELEEAVIDRKRVLQDIVDDLGGKPEYVKKEDLVKTVQMMKTSIDTASKVLEYNTKKEEVIASEIELVSNEASQAVEQIMQSEKKDEEDIKLFLGTDENVEKESDEINDANDKVETEMRRINPYYADRVHKMVKEIEEKMKYHKIDLLAKWRNQKDLIDYQALKEFRNEFEATHKKMRYMVNEWERRKISDVLADYMIDIVDRCFDEYIVEFRAMDEEKRLETALFRKRNLEIDEYRKEKRRAIPLWPSTLSYTKFKPDLLSWDKEHHQLLII